jgi:hypothetical protein
MYAELVQRLQMPKGGAMRPQSFGEKGGGQMNKSKKSFAVAVGVAGAIALSVPVSAAPVTSSTAALKNAAPSDVVQVRSRWGGRAAAVGIGFAAGALIGAAATSAYAYPHTYAYSDPYWYGHEPAFGYTYASSPWFGSTCHWGDPWCHGGVAATFAAPAPAFVEPAPVYAAPRPVVRRRSRVIVDPGPAVFAGPQPLFYPRQLFLDANPALGTVQGASGVD